MVISFSAVFSSILVAVLIDYFRRRMKIATLLLLSASGILAVLSTLLFENVFSSLSSTGFKSLLYILLLGVVCLACSLAPIAFEFCVELCYPVNEGVLGNWLVLWFNVISAVYLGVFQIPGIGTRWMNFLLPVSVLLPLPITFLIDAQYRRSMVDN